MKYFTAMKNGLVLFLLIIFSFSCGGEVTTRTPPSEYKFTINGVVVKDLNSGKDIAYFAILRDGNPFDGAMVEVGIDTGTDTLDNQGNGNYYLDGFSLFTFGQNVSINISSAADEFNLSTSVLMPGSFEITNINHTTVTSALADQVVVYFSSSADASGYFKSIVRPNGANGYTALIPATEIGQTGIDAVAFYEAQEFVTGTYQLFLVSYRGSFLYYPGMEFYLPAGLPAGNISGADGTIGAGVVVPSVSLEAED